MGAIGGRIVAVKHGILLVGMFLLLSPRADAATGGSISGTATDNTRAR